MSNRVDSSRYEFCQYNYPPGMSVDSLKICSRALSSLNFPVFFCSPFSSFFLCTFIGLKSVYRTDLKLYKGRWQFQAPKSLRRKFSSCPLWCYYQKFYFSSVSPNSLFIAIDRHLTYFLKKFDFSLVPGIDDYEEIKRAYFRFIDNIDCW